MCLACFHHLPRYTSFHLFFEIYALPDAMTRVINRPNQSLDEALCNLAQHLLLVRQVLSLTLLSSLRFLGSIEPLSHLPVNRLYIVRMYTWNKKKHHIIFIVICQTKKENEKGVSTLACVRSYAVASTQNVLNTSSHIVYISPTNLTRGWFRSSET